LKGCLFERRSYRANNSTARLHCSMNIKLGRSQFPRSSVLSRVICFRSAARRRIPFSGRSRPESRAFPPYRAVIRLRAGQSEIAAQHLLTLLASLRPSHIRDRQGRRCIIDNSSMILSMICHNYSAKIWTCRNLFFFLQV